MAIRFGSDEALRVLLTDIAAERRVLYAAVRVARGVVEAGPFWADSFPWVSYLPDELVHLAAYDIDAVPQDKQGDLIAWMDHRLDVLDAKATGLHVRLGDYTERTGVTHGLCEH